MKDMILLMAYLWVCGARSGDLCSIKQAPRTRVGHIDSPLFLRVTHALPAIYR